MNVNMYLYCVTVCTQAIGDTHTVSARGGVEEQSECQLCTQVKEGGNYAGEERGREGGREGGRRVRETCVLRYKVALCLVCSQIASCYMCRRDVYLHYPCTIQFNGYQSTTQ